MITFYEIIPDRYFQHLYSNANKIKPCKFVKEISEFEPSDVCICNRIPTTNIPATSLILLINYNPMVNDLEMFHFSKSNATQFDAIWLNETYSTYKSYIETITKSPVIILPNIWKPFYRPDIKYLFGSNKTDLVIVGNHGSWNQSGLKPLLIAEALNKKHPDKIGTIFFMNAQDNHELLLNYIETMTCRSKIRVFVKLNEQTIIGHFLKSQNKVIFLTNSVMDEIPQLFYDILFAQYPFVHSLQTLRDKYEMTDYYENTDLEAAVHKIQHIMETGKFSICNEDVLNKLNNTDITKHLIEAFTNNSTKATALKELIAKSIVSDVLEIENIHQPLVVAYDNNPTENTNAFIQTLKHNNWQYMIVGQGEVWEGWSTRLKKYKEVLELLPKDKVVILSDARDVFCVRNTLAFNDGFKALNPSRNKLVVCGEMICDGRFIEDYNPAKPSIQNKCLDNYWKHSGGAPPLRQFVNNGLVCGYVDSLLEYFVWTTTCGISDDQLALATYTDLFPEKVVLDYDLGLFHSSVFGHNAGMIHPHAQNTDAPTFAELAGRSVFFLHIPGLRFKGQQRVYESIKQMLLSGYSDTHLRQDYPYPTLGWNQMSKPAVIHKQTLGAYYQCYKNPKSFLRVMKSFQTHYPGSTVVVSNDGGDDYSSYCASITTNPVHYTYYPKTRPPSKQLAYRTVEPLLDFLSRLWKSFPMYKESHIVFLEDDVHILRRHTNSFQHTINGMNPAYELPKAMKDVLIEKGYKGHFYLGGCGGCVISKQFYERIPFSEVEALMRKVQVPVYASDVALVFIALYYGGSINKYDEFGEMFYPNINSLLVENKLAFLHQYKLDYGHPLTDAEARALQPKISLNDIISHVVYINLEERTDRREKIEVELAKVFSKSKIHRYNAHKHETGAIGCSLSHAGVIELAKKEKWPHVLVVEDDFVFTENKDKGEVSFVEHYKKAHDVILFGGTFVQCTKEFRIRNSASAVGYFVESHYYDALYNNFKEGVDQLIKTNNYPVYACDRYWNRIQIRDNWFITNPMICSQREEYSDIEKKSVDYGGWGYFRVEFVD